MGVRGSRGMCDCLDPHDPDSRFMSPPQGPCQDPGRKLAQRSTWTMVLPVSGSASHAVCEQGKSAQRVG